MEEQMNELDPMAEFEAFVGELANKYQMEQEDVDILIDNVNALVGGEETAEGETWVCPECGAEVPADVPVCPECGYSLEGGEEVPAEA